MDSRPTGGCFLAQRTYSKGGSRMKILSSPAYALPFLARVGGIRMIYGILGQYVTLMEYDSVWGEWR